MRKYKNKKTIKNRSEIMLNECKSLGINQFNPISITAIVLRNSPQP